MRARLSACAGGCNGPSGRGGEGPVRDDHAGNAPLVTARAAAGKKACPKGLRTRLLPVHGACFVCRPFRHPGSKVTVSSRARRPLGLPAVRSQRLQGARRVERVDLLPLKAPRRALPADVRLERKRRSVAAQCGPVALLQIDAPFGRGFDGMA